jgi:hypothetical protein
MLGTPRAIAQLGESNSSFKLRRVAAHLLSAAGKLEFVVELDHGQYIAVIIDDLESNYHAVGVDVTQKKVYDSEEEFVMRLCKPALDRSSGSSSGCLGNPDVREVARKQAPAQRKRSSSKQSSGRYAR